MLKHIELDNLGDLDNGAARITADAEIRKAIDDLIDRGKDDGKSRKVALEFEAYWLNGRIVCHLSSQAKLPPRRTNGTACVEKDVKGESVLAFRDDNSDNAEQPTLDDMN